MRLHRAIDRTILCLYSGRNENLRMRLLFLDTKPNNPNRYISRAVFSALRRHPHVTEAVWVTYADALKVGLERPFDALLAFDGEEAGNPIVERLCAAIPRRAIWFTEDPYEF